MNTTQKELLRLLDCALWERTPEAPEQPVDWAALVELAQEHKIDGMILDTACMLPAEAYPPQEVLVPWQERTMIVMVGQMGAVSQLHMLLEALEEKEIHAITIKGVALKALYPQPDLRTMSDADILVEENRFEEACQVLLEQGYVLDEEEPGVKVFQGPDGLRVELHFRLFDQTSYGFLSRLDEAALFPHACARKEEVYMGQAWVFPPAQHLLFMLCHIAKHVITTGFGLRQTMDFIVFSKRYDEVLDWEWFWKQARNLGLEGLARATLHVGEKYFSLGDGCWKKDAPQSSDEATEGLLADVMDSGVFGSRTQERVHSAAVVYRAYETQDGDSGRILRALFPSAATLKAPYLYARDHHWLLPAAWIHRWINFALRFVTGKHKSSELKGGLEMADHRLKLLDDLGMRDE